MYFYLDAIFHTQHDLNLSLQMNMVTNKLTKVSWKNLPEYLSDFTVISLQTMTLN